MTKGMALPAIGILSMLALSTPTLAQTQSKCAQPSVLVRGRVDLVGHDIDRSPVVRSSLGCYAVLADSTGAFVLPTVPVAQILVGHLPGFCVFPVDIRGSQSIEAPVRMALVEEKNALDDSVIMVRGGGYVPPTYEQRNCERLNSYVRENPDVRNLAGVPELPTPDSVLRVVLSREDLAWPLGTDSVLRFRYWNEPNASASGRVGARAYELGTGPGYLIVRDVTPDRLEIQVGSTNVTGHEAGLRAVIDLRSGLITLIEQWGREDGVGRSAGLVENGAPVR